LVGIYSKKVKNVGTDNGQNAPHHSKWWNRFCIIHVKHGSGVITFVQGSGRTLILDATAVFNGVATAAISSVGLVDYPRISNA
jgi:hypothetical protein